MKYLPDFHQMFFLSIQYPHYASKNCFTPKFVNKIWVFEHGRYKLNKLLVIKSIKNANEQDITDKFAILYIKVLKDKKPKVQPLQ